MCSIALNSVGNQQGNYYFMLLTTGERITQSQWREIPILDAVNVTIEHIAQQQGEPRIINSNLRLELTLGVPLKNKEPVLIHIISDIAVDPTPNVQANHAAYKQQPTNEVQ